MTDEATKIKLIRMTLLVDGFDLIEVDSFMSKFRSWYPIWCEFKNIAFKNYRANIKRGDRDFKGQMAILDDVRGMRPSTGNKPYSVDNNLAPKFAVLFNALTKTEYFEIRGRSKKSKHSYGEAA